LPGRLASALLGLTERRKLDAERSTITITQQEIGEERTLPLLREVTEMAEIGLFAGRCRGPYADPLVIWDIFACEECARARMHRNHVLRRGNGRGETVLIF
jgi:hypothetical protein